MFRDGDQEGENEGLRETVSVEDSEPVNEAE